MTDSLNEYKLLKDKLLLSKQYYNNLKKATAVKARLLFNEIFKDFMTDNPEVRQIHWTQSTPSFADGDIPRFGIGELCLRFNSDFHKSNMRLGFDPTSEDLEYEGENYWVSEDSVRGQEILNNFNKLITLLRDSELFEAIFGNGVKVIITKDGISTNEYYSD